MTNKDLCLRCETPKDDHWTEKSDWSENYPSDSRYHEWTNEVSLTSELEELLRKYSCESVSGTPVQVLAYVMLEAVKDYNEAVVRRAEWRGEALEFTNDHMKIQRVKNSIQDAPELDPEDRCALCGVERYRHWDEGISDSHTYQVNPDYTRHEFVAEKLAGDIYSRDNIDDVERQLVIGKPICKYCGWPAEAHTDGMHVFSAM